MEIARRKSQLWRHNATRHKAEVDLYIREAESKSRLRLLGFLDLAFFEYDVLTSNRIVLVQLKLLGVVLWVFLCNVEKASIGRAYKLNVVFGFSHFIYPKVSSNFRRLIPRHVNVTPARPAIQRQGQERAQFP